MLLGAFFIDSVAAAFIPLQTVNFRGASHCNHTL